VSSVPFVVSLKPRSSAFISGFNRQSLFTGFSGAFALLWCEIPLSALIKEQKE
jgi:hypothetical protein